MEIVKIRNSGRNRKKEKFFQYLDPDLYGIDLGQEKLSYVCAPPLSIGIKAIFR